MRPQRPGGVGKASVSAGAELTARGCASWCWHVRLEIPVKRSERPGAHHAFHMQGGQAQGLARVEAMEGMGPACRHTRGWAGPSEGGRQVWLITRRLVGPEQLQVGCTCRRES